jgi:acetyl esterase/lipase
MKGIIAIIVITLFFGSAGLISSASAQSRFVVHTTEIDTVVYCSPGGEDLVMNLYLADGTGPRPVVVQVHGGGWVAGSQDSILLAPSYFTEAGISMVSVEYRLAPNYKFPAPEQDVACAVRFLRAHAAEFNLDPGEIGLLGTSAGGQITDALSLTGGGVSRWGYGADDQWTNYSSSVQADVTWFGPTNVTESSQFSSSANTDINEEFGTTFDAQAAGSPVYFVTKDAPPILLMHGYNDTTVSYLQSIELYNLLVQSGDNTKLVLVDNAGHTWSHDLRWPPMDPSLQQIYQMTIDWYQSYL